MTRLGSYLSRDDLILTTDQYAHRFRKRNDVEPNSIASGQVLSGTSLSDGKRLMIVSYDRSSTEKVQSFLDKEELVYSVSNNSFYDSIYIYPNANKGLLGIQAQPSEGNVQILQGEYAITHANDPNPILSTFGIDSCVGLLLFNPHLRLGSVAHVDYSHEVVPTLKKMLEELDTFGAQKLLFGRTPNIDPMTESYGILSKWSDRFYDKIKLPRKFSFDTRTGVVGQYQTSEDPTLNKRIQEKTHHRLEEHITICFPVYRPKAQPQ